ncbi:transglutaminase domain-containing protein [Brevibacillus porteri]|uniref:transglutaminase domain-containing protein n=1 Tax=Brevibacillus porteri TaxID=2126350 RepID=UPI003D23D731
MKKLILTSSAVLLLLTSFSNPINANANHGLEKRLIFDFGTATSPLLDEANRVTSKTLYDKNKGFGWKQTTDMIIGQDEMTLDPIATDYLEGKGGETFSVSVPNGTYQVLIESGSKKQDVQIFHFELNARKEVFQHNYENITTVASPKGRATQHIYTVDVTNGMLEITLNSKWLINAVVITKASQIQLVDIKQSINQNKGESDFYSLLSRENGLMWSKKFGYDYGKNWDYLIKRRDEIIKELGLANSDSLTKLSGLARYLDEQTYNSFNTIPNIDELNSPVDILDMDGSKKGSCFGLARTLALFANSYGLPARLVEYHTTPEGSIYNSILYPQIQLLDTKNLGPYHVETEIFLGGKWRLFTNGPYEPLEELDAVEVVNNPEKVKKFEDKYLVYSNTERIRYIHLTRANYTRDEDLQTPLNSYVFYDPEKAFEIYPNKPKQTVRVRNSDFNDNVIRIGQYYQSSGFIKLGEKGVSRVKRAIYVPQFEGEISSIQVNIPIQEYGTTSNPPFYVNINGQRVSAKKINDMPDITGRRGGLYLYKLSVPSQYINFDKVNEIELVYEQQRGYIDIPLSYLNNVFYEGNKKIDSFYSNSFYSFGINDGYVRMINDPIVYLDFSME